MTSAAMGIPHNPHNPQPPAGKLILLTRGIALHVCFMMVKEGSLLELMVLKANMILDHDGVGLWELQSLPTKLFSLIVKVS